MARGSDASSSPSPHEGWQERCFLFHCSGRFHSHLRCHAGQHSPHLIVVEGSFFELYIASHTEALWPLSLVGRVCFVLALICNFPLSR
mmetsp:Transcript_39328/g.98954  ORF Transcript_39328/g.98954 Transcript_39328/m.98954 type:complete len:88 (-) Transcript_39328:33-296(-)